MYKALMSANKQLRDPGEDQPKPKGACLSQVFVTNDFGYPAFLCRRTTSCCIRLRDINRQEYPLLHRRKPSWQHYCYLKTVTWPYVDGTTFPISTVSCPRGSEHMPLRAQKRRFRNPILQNPTYQLRSAHHLTPNWPDLPDHICQAIQPLVNSV
jgi:hypothetical protein